MAEQQTSTEKEIEDIIEKNSTGLVCQCGGGGTSDNNDICKICNGTGIFNWKHDFSAKKILELMSEDRETETIT